MYRHRDNTLLVSLVALLVIGFLLEDLLFCAFCHSTEGVVTRVSHHRRLPDTVFVAYKAEGHYFESQSPSWFELPMGYGVGDRAQVLFSEGEPKHWRYGELHERILVRLMLLTGVACIIGLEIGNSRLARTARLTRMARVEPQ